MYNSQKVFNANILVYALLFVFMIPLQSNAQEISANTLSCNFTIGDFVWNDTNANGIQDSGEPGIQNVLVLLYRGNGTKLTQTTTNSSGYYYFDAGVYGYGDYKVKFILPSGYTFSPKDIGDYDKDSDADETTGETIVFSCNNDGDYFTVDAGMYKNSIIGDFVWNDADKDGKQDYNESGISGVEVKIYKSNGTYVGSANTNDAGYYKFENLSENDYYLQFVLKSGYAFSPQDQGDNSYDSDANTSTGETATTHLSAGEIDPTWDAGMYVDNAPQLASVGDFVWYDGDENGMQNTDGSSVGVDNVNVELFNSGGGSEGTTQTNSNGWYSFTDLTPGDYYLKFSNLPNGYVFTAKDQGSDASIDSDVNPANGQTDVFNLVAGENDMKKDAGIYETANIIPPSDPTCDENTSLLWENNIVINDCNVSFDVRFVNGQTTQYTIPTPYPSAFNGSVDITISEAIAWDGYCDRPGTGDQPNERFRVVFKKGGSVVWSSPYTGGTNDGIDTGVISDEWVGPLGTTVNLPNGADEIILVHWSNDAYGEGDHSNANSVVPSSVCIGYETGAPNVDYGDAPSTYGDINVSITGGYESYLGTIADGENGMQYSTNADGDDVNGTDDEDGVTFVGGNTLMVNTGEQVTLSWSTTLNDGHINGWIDFNGDGNFDTNERVITDHLIGSGSGNAVGNKTFNYIVPADAVCGTSYARFLIADNNISHSPTGSYQYGEVEDYKVVIDGCGGDIVPPSDPTCDENTSLLWENNIVINDCNVSFDVRFVNGQTTQYTIPTPYPSAFNGSVDITISEAIAWDGYCDRPGTGDQPNERFRVVFKKGGSVVWSSPYTGGTNDGIDTGVISDEWVGPLGTTVNLPNGADEIILVHWSNDAYGEGDHSNANSVVPSSVCIGYETVTPELGSIGNWVWHDTYHYPASGPPNNDHDVDGIQDSGELGIEGVLVELRQGNSVIYTKTTDATGFYEFTNLPAGDYVVRVANSNFATGGILEGWYAAPQNRGGNDALDSDGNNLETQPFEQPVNLSEGEHDPTVDFGFFFTCVDLIKTGPTSVKVGETVTYHFRYENCGDIVHHGGAFVYDPMINPYGDHEIWNGVVWPGQVVEFDKTYTTTEDDCGELENCAWAIGHTVPPYKYTPNLPWDRDDDCWKLKVLCCEIEIGDYVWWDENHNGEQDDDTLFPGNAPHGINDVRVILYDGSGNYLDETITTNGPSGGTGWYEFIDLLPGDYIVKVDPNTVPGDLIYQTFDYDGIDTQHEAKVTLVDCETNYDLDFGYDDEPLPVTLASFTANSSNGEVILTWVTESEIENQGFILERRTEGNGDWLEIANFTTYPELKGQGTVTYSTTYNFIDRLVQRGQSYEYRLGDVDYDGVVEYHATRIVEVDETSLSTVPNQFAVKPAYPNPFNPSTVIEYAIPEEGKVNITIYDLMGQKISTLRNETQTSGWHQVRWNGQDDHGVSMPAGVYLISVNAGNSIKTMKLIFVK